MSRTSKLLEASIDTYMKTLHQEYDPKDKEDVEAVETIIAAIRRAGRKSKYSFLIEPEGKKNQYIDVTISSNSGTILPKDREVFRDKSVPMFALFGISEAGAARIVGDFEKIASKGKADDETFYKLLVDEIKHEGGKR